MTHAPVLIMRKTNQNIIQNLRWFICLFLRKVRLLKQAGFNALRSSHNVCSTALLEACDKYGMYLFVDGARLGYGLGAVENDISVEDFAALTDVFYFGGTKCGALFGEAVVITSNDLKRRFKAFMKQNGAVLAKGWLLGLQFYTLLENDLYFEITKKADVLAMKIRDAFAKKGIPFWVKSPTNQQFVILTDAQKETLEKRYIFEPMGKSADGGNIARFCTSWATTEEEVQTLIDDLKAL